MSLVVDARAEAQLSCPGNRGRGMNQCRDLDPSGADVVEDLSTDPVVADGNEALCALFACCSNCGLVIVEHGHGPKRGRCTASSNHGNDPAIDRIHQVTYDDGVSASAEQHDQRIRAHRTTVDRPPQLYLGPSDVARSPVPRVLPYSGAQMKDPMEHDGRLGALCVGMDATIKEAMRAIDVGAVEIALVVDDARVLLGTLTDGDIRRALLGGASLQDPVLPYARADFTSLGVEADRAWALDLMISRDLAQIPVVDTTGHLVGLHLLRDIVGRPTRPETAVIMAGGKGTRLHPLTETIPKPMLKVAGRPILERIVLHLVGAGITHIHLAVNYRADQIEDWFGDGTDFGCRITYLHEQTDHPLGTAGALSLLPEEVLCGSHPVLVMNGDVVTSFDPVLLLDRHRFNAPLATVGATRYSHHVPFGVLHVKDAELVGVAEKPEVTWRVSAGINVLSPEALRQVPADVRYDMTQLIEACGERGSVLVHMLDEEWIDIGRNDDLRLARGER